MTSPQKMPFLLLVLLVAGLAACGGQNDVALAPQPPPPSGEAAINALSISQGTLSPPFSKSVASYGASIFSDGSGFAVTAVTSDPAARLTIGGAPARSGVPAVVPITKASTTVWVVVESEDGRNTAAARLTVESAPLNTSVWVLGSVGGVAVEDATLTVRDTFGRVLQEDIPLPAERNGSKVLGLPPNRKFNIYAKGRGTAEACFADFDPSREDTATLYCRPLWGGGFFPAEAPIITDVSFAAANAADAHWRPLVGENHLAAPASEMAALRVTALAKCAIAQVADGPPPMRIRLDGMASDSLEGSVRGAVMEEAALTMESGDWYYRTTHRFDLPVRNDIWQRDHWLDIVVYDLANNRTERRVYLTVMDSAPNVGGDADISSIQPKLFWLHAETYGMDLELPAVRPIDGLGASYNTQVIFRMGADLYGPLSSFPPIRGYEVWRSDGDNQDYKKIGTVHFAAPSRGEGEGEGGSYIYFFTYMDRSPDVVEDFMFYRVRAFNGNPASGGFSLFSNAMMVSPLPPFTTSLAYPAHSGVSSKLWPTFKYRITNKALYGPVLADGMSFTLYVKDIYGNDPIFDAGFWVDFTELDGKGNPSVYFFDNFRGGWWYADYAATDEGGNPVRRPFVWMEDGDTIVIDTDNETFRRGIAYAGLLPGAAYEWSIFGFEGGVLWNNLSPYSDNAAYFYKIWPNPADAPGDAECGAFSYGSTMDHGLGSTNGFFTLIIDADAK